MYSKGALFSVLLLLSTGFADASKAKKKHHTTTSTSLSTTTTTTTTGEAAETPIWVCNFRDTYTEMQVPECHCTAWTSKGSGEVLVTQSGDDGCNDDCSTCDLNPAVSSAKSTAEVKSTSTTAVNPATQTVAWTCSFRNTYTETEVPQCHCVAWTKGKGSGTDLVTTSGQYGCNDDCSTCDIPVSIANE